MDLPTPGEPVIPMSVRRPAGGASAAMTSRSCGDGVLDQGDQPGHALAASPVAGTRDQRVDVRAARRGVTRTSAAAGRGASGRRPDRRRRTAPPRRRRRRGGAARGQVQRDPGAGHADRVAERDRAAVDVDLLGVRRRGRASTGSPTDGERLVDLDQVEVGDVRPALRSAWLIAFDGWDCSELSGPATMPCAPISASQVEAELVGLGPDITTTAQAPSEICDGEPAVIVPSGANAGRSLASARRSCRRGRPRPR